MFVQNLMRQRRTSFRLALFKSPYMCFKLPFSSGGASWQIASEAKRYFRFPTHGTCNGLKMDLGRQSLSRSYDDIVEEDMFKKHLHPERITQDKKRLSRHAHVQDTIGTEWNALLDDPSE